MKLLSMLAMATFTMGIVSNTAAEVKPLHAHASVLIQTSTDEVWKIVKDFGDLGWHPAVATTTLRLGSPQEPGSLRLITLRDGSTLVEKLLGIEERSRTQTYTIVESPLPVTHYRCSIAVADEGNGRTRVTWESYFQPSGTTTSSEAEAAKLTASIAEIYSVGLENLKKRLESD